MRFYKPLNAYNKDKIFNQQIDWMVHEYACRLVTHC